MDSTKPAAKPNATKKTETLANDKSGAKKSGSSSESKKANSSETKATPLIVGGIIIALVAAGIIGLIALDSGETDGGGGSGSSAVTEQPQGNCTVIECMKKLSPSDSIEKITEIIGVEGKKSDYSEEYTWKLDSKNWITRKTATGSASIQATIDKSTIKNDNVDFPSASELQEMLNSGSFTYEELVKKLGGAEGTLYSVGETSKSYMWVNRHDQTLGATFNNETKKCTVASLR